MSISRDDGYNVIVLIPILVVIMFAILVDNNCCTSSWNDNY